VLKMAGSQPQAKHQMTLVFHRTGQRRYAVKAQRPGLPDLEMNPAPGYDPLMPHDMMHMVVEAQLGLTRAIFGQLAAGGDAGTFHLFVEGNESSRAIARARNRVKARGRKLLKGGGDECVQSELATHICRYEWLARSSPHDQSRASETAKQAKELRDTTSVTLPTLNQHKLDEICKHLDQLSAQWSRLKIGQSMSVEWPSLAILTSPEILSAP
jgi:hypothetical protein